MPFVNNTPESRLPRSDSKDPSTTCKGITLNGNRCKNSTAVSARAALASAASLQPESLPNGDSQNGGAAAFFCWRHKNQAEVLAPTSSCRFQTKTMDLRKRSSIDTLVDRLGVLDIKERCGSKAKKNTGQARGNADRSTLPKQEQRTPGSRIAVSEEPLHTHEKVPIPSVAQPRQRRRANGSLIFHLSLFFCIRGPDLEEAQNPPPRIRTTASAKPPPEMAQTRNPHSRNLPSAAPHSPPARPSDLSYPPTCPNPDRRPLLAQESPPRSQTHTLLALIPPHLNPQTTSLLLAELAKPLPPFSEPGYIYMFWLTPDSTPAPSPSMASSLLSAPPSPSPLTGATLRPSPPTLMLKIGRASNVTRRLNEWTRQCGYHLSLVRYYPYHPSAPPPPLPASSGATEVAYPRKVPRVARVERLVHLELAEMRVRRLCAGCAKEHREWFEVQGSREGLRAVDEVVRRWVAWGAGV